MERPKYLYRFRSMADNVLRGRVREILVDHKVFLAAPASFNDPFDCWPLFDDLATEGEYIRFWASLLGTEGRGLAQAIEYARAMTARDPAALQSSQQALAGLRDSLLRTNGTLCLNTDPFHQLMWSHYGDSHKGICIQFDARSEFFSNTEPVCYSADRPRLNIFSQNQDDQFRHSVLTKSDVWAYEKEWRIVFAGYVGHNDIPAESITGVILGARADEGSCAAIQQWANQNAKQIPVYKASLHDGSYRIEIPGLPTSCPTLIT